MTIISTDGGTLKVYLGGPLDTDAVQTDQKHIPPSILVFRWNEEGREYDGYVFIRPPEGDST